VQAELRDDKSEVTVTSLMPGPTETNFFHRADMDDTNVGSSAKDDPAKVAEQGYEAMLKGKDKVFGGSVTSQAQGKLAGCCRTGSRPPCTGGWRRAGGAS
jgi:short-subunit dehydrogenase